MASFSERIGKRASKTVLQVDSLDKDSRIALWNVVVKVRDIIAPMPAHVFGMDTVEEEITMYLWTRVYKKPRDEMQGTTHIWQIVKSAILRGEWFEAFDLIEALVKRLDDPDNAHLTDLQPLVREAFNEAFKQELVGYRFVGTTIASITDQIEVEAMNEALEITPEHHEARRHLNRAVELYADRHAPDYLNSIKESISAVESIVRVLSGGRTLDDGLKKLEVAGITVHSALKAAWGKLYGWTSDEHGIRHGGIRASEVDQSLAKYMLISCSAFVSYLIEESNKKGLLT